MEFFIKEELVYEDPNITLKSLSGKLNTTTNNLSWLLNNIYKTSFYDFINSYRIQSFQDKIDNNEHLRVTLLAIALEVGFSSKSTFNRAFKLHTGLTLTQYLKQKQSA